MQSIGRQLLTTLVATAMFAGLCGCRGDGADKGGPATSITNSLGMEMVQVNATSYMGKYEVRQTDFLALMDRNPSHHKGDLQRPVEQVTDEEASAFCEKLTELERERHTLPQGFVYRLPSVSQWRACARSAPLDRSVTPRGRDPDPVSPMKVGSGEQNDLGICDLRGNVQEWCRDRHNTGTLTLVGASWNTFRGEWYSIYNTSGFVREDREARSYCVGFRCVLEKVGRVDTPDFRDDPIVGLLAFHIIAVALAAVCHVLIKRLILTSALVALACMTVSGGTHCMEVVGDPGPLFTVGLALLGAYTFVIAILVGLVARALRARSAAAKAESEYDPST